MSLEATAYLPEMLGNSTEVRQSESCELKPLFAPLSTIQVEPSALGSVAAVVTHSEERSDEALLKRVQQGTKEALATLFRRHALMVRNVAHRILRNEAEADDLVQDIFIFLFQKAAIFDASRGSARSWIVHITYHRAFDRRRYLMTRHFYRDQNPEQDALMVPDPRSEILSYEWSLEGVWGKRSAAKIKELLSPAQLKTIELFFFEGYTLEEVAESTGQSLVNTRNHYYRGLEKLRRPAFARKLRSK